MKLENGPDLSIQAIQANNVIQPTGSTPASSCGSPLDGPCRRASRVDVTRQDGRRDGAAPSAVWSAVWSALRAAHRSALRSALWARSAVWPATRPAADDTAGTASSSSSSSSRPEFGPAPTRTGRSASSSLYCHQTEVSNCLPKVRACPLARTLCTLWTP